MRLSTPLSPRTGPGLFEFLTAGMKGPGLGSGGPQPRLPPPWRRPVLRHSQPLLYLGGGRAGVPERNGVPRTPPPTSPPPDVHNPGRLFEEFSSLPCVGDLFRLGSSRLPGSPPRGGGDRPFPTRYPLPHPWSPIHLQPGRPGPAPGCSRWLYWTWQPFWEPRNLTSGTQATL